ncbi:MAG: carboxyltransferase domain-containing protein, partial [Gammaproteobacteria bacterium]|nr:carboxyltransferase domain-containing protein [Gammaproteobacteria bacterium]
LPASRTLMLRFDPVRWSPERLTAALVDALSQREPAAPRRVAGPLVEMPVRYDGEDLAEVDRFCDAMIAIHAEMTAVETGKADKANNLLKGAPHTADQIAGDWMRPYTREQAAFPVKSLVDYKFWPPVARVDNVFGDRNLVCSCAGMENYQ